MSEVLPVCVYTAFGQLEANVVKGMLESEGIPVVLQYESLGLIMGGMADNMGAVRVMVPDTMEAKALAILAEAEEDGPENAAAAEEEEENKDNPEGAV